jgi:FdhE protein
MPAPAELLVQLDRRTTALRKSRPDLAEPLDLQELLIRTTLAAARRPRAEPFPMPREQGVGRVRQGIPLLHDQPVSLDVHFAADLFSRLVDSLTQRNDQELNARLEPIVAAATGGALDPEHLFDEAFVQHVDHLAELAAQAGVDADLLLTLATKSVAPLLQSYAEHLLPLLERVDDGTSESAAWHLGYCPVCGGWPLLGELRGVELSLWLRCSACGSAWRGQRLACPYCANNDYRSLGSLAIEGEQRFRIAVCERCQAYLKVGNAFDPTPAALLALDDVASLHLDLAAIERGYRRPSGTGYRIELATPEAEWLEELA